MNKDGSIAKISDFGQAKFHPMATSVEYLTTRQPGTILYMPPEALVGKPHFTDKGDIFSLGVVLLQFSTEETPSCGLGGTGIQKEVECRAADLAKLPDNRPLRAIILQCLQDDPAERLSCLEVLHYLLEHNVSCSEHMHALQPHTVAVLSSSDVILHCSHTCTYTRYIAQDSPHTSSGDYT